MDIVATKDSGSKGDSRWPRSVYGAGSEPDPRFSFANERTFLAWIRTALALLAGGAAVEALELPMGEVLQTTLAAILVLLGLLCAVSSWLRWARAERAMRTGMPLPSMGLAAPLVVGILAIGILLIVASLAR
ncbi:MAG: YidH family protein [Nocardioidaceae bacterium]